MTSDRSTESEILADAAAIRQGTTRLARVMRSGRSAGALSTNKIAVLSRLRARGPSTPGEIAAADRQQPQSLTRVFAELAQAGLIVRAAAEDDRRQSIISLTEAGIAALDQDLAERDAWLAGEIADLSDTERGVLLLAVRLMERIADRGPSSAMRGRLGGGALRGQQGGHQSLILLAVKYEQDFASGQQAAVEVGQFLAGLRQQLGDLPGAPRASVTNGGRVRRRPRVLYRQVAVLVSHPHLLRYMDCEHRFVQVARADKRDDRGVGALISIASLTADMRRCRAAIPVGRRRDRMRQVGRPLRERPEGGPGELAAQDFLMSTRQLRSRLDTESRGDRGPCAGKELQRFSSAPGEVERGHQHADQILGQWLVD